MVDTTAINIKKDTEVTADSTPVEKSPAYEFFFTETYQQLPKLRLAPDLLVYINNSRTFRTWLGDTFDFNDWLVSASGAAGMDRQNSCNLTFYIPRHLEHYFVGLGGRFILRPFQEVEIYAKGRFLVDASSDEYSSEAELYGAPLDASDPQIPTSRFYRIFWGWVQSITSEWQEGDYQIIVQCSMALRVMELTHLRNNLVALGSIDRQTDITPFDNPGILGNPFHVIVEVFNKDVTAAQEINCTNVAVSSPQNQAIYTAGNMGMNESYKRNAARSLLVWDQRIKELQKRTTIFGLGYSDSDAGKTNETPTTNMSSAEAIASEVMKRGVAQSAGESSVSLLDLKKRERQILPTQISDLEIDIAKATADRSSKEAELNKKRSSDFKFVIDIVKSSSNVRAVGNTYFYTAHTLPIELKTISDIDAPDTNPELSIMLNDYISSQVSAYTFKITAWTSKLKELKDRVATLDTEIKALSDTVTTYKASLKAEVQPLSKSLVVGPLSLADLISHSASAQRTNPKQAPNDGPKVGVKQDSKTGVWNLYVQDWASANYTPFFKLSDFKMFNFDENITRLEILVRMADVVGYEFYQDLSGNIIFKPPFYNMDTRGDAVFNINDIDILSEQVAEDESQIKLTSAIVLGSYHPMIEDSTPPELKPMGQWVDLNLISKYGQRTKSITMPMLRTPEQAQVYAISSVAKENRFAKRINIQIPARPELMLGFPVYLPGRDCFGYLERINWTYSAGNDFVFQVELSGIRRRIYINRNRLESLKKSRPGIKINDLPQDPPKKSADAGSSTPATNAAPTQSQTQNSKKPDPSTTGRAYPLPKIYPVSNKGTFGYPRPTHRHNGVDLATGDEGVVVYAPCNGTITSADINVVNANSFGVEITSTDGFKIVFKHLLKVNVELNQRCEAGKTVVGTVGGGPRCLAAVQAVSKSITKLNSSGAHLHWSVKKLGLSNDMKGYIDPYTWLDSNSGCTYGGKQGEPACEKPVEFKPTFSCEILKDIGRVQTRLNTGTNLADMVPLPNAAIQIFRNPAGEAYGQNGFIATGNVTSSSLKTSQDSLVAAQAVSKDLSVAQNAYSSKEIEENTKSDNLASELSDLNTSLEQAQYNSSSLHVPEPVDNLLPSYCSQHTTLYTDFLTKSQNFKSSKKAYDQDDTLANKAALDLAESLYLAAYLAASKECLGSISAQIKEKISQITKANIDKEATLKPLQASINKLNKSLTESTQIARDSVKDTISYKSGRAQEYSATEVDDFLDADPDCQIFAFGQDTFKDPQAQFNLTNATKAEVAARERKLDASAYLRPNGYHPYRIIIDPVFMGPLKPTQPQLKSDYDGALTGTSISWRNGVIPATKPDITSAQGASDLATKTLSDVKSELSNLQNELASEKAKRLTAQSNLNQLALNLVKKSDVDSFKYVITLYENGKGLTDVSKLRVKLPTDLLENFVSRDPATKDEPYSLSVVFDETPDLSEFISFVTKCLGILQTTYTTQQASLKELQSVIKSRDSRIKELESMIEVSSALESRCQSVKSSATKRLNALSRGSSGNTVVTETSLDTQTYLRALCMQQPYTDANGFEQIPGFPWGRSVSVTSAVDTLRIDATAKKFIDMSPQVYAKKAVSLLTKQNTDLPQPVSKDGSDAVTALANLQVQTASVSESMGINLSAGIATSKDTSLKLPTDKIMVPPSFTSDDSSKEFEDGV